MSLLDFMEPVASLKKKSGALIARVLKTGRAVVLTQHGKPKAVLQGVEQYEKQRQALLFLKLLARGGKDSASSRGRTHARARARRSRKARAAKK